MKGNSSSWVSSKLQNCVEEVGCRDFVSPLFKVKVETLICSFLFCSDSHPPTSVKNKKYDLPTAASIQAMSQRKSQRYGSDDLFATEV